MGWDEEKQLCWGKEVDISTVLQRCCLLVWRIVHGSRSMKVISLQPFERSSRVEGGWLEGV